MTTGGHTKPRRYLLLSLLLSGIGLALASESDARVFLRWGQADSLLRPKETGWSEAFRGEVRIDGRKMQTQIYSGRVTCRSSLKRLETIFENKGAEYSGFGGDEIGWGLAVWPDKRANVLVISPRAFKTSLVFIFSSPLPEKGGIERHPLDKIPDFPGARLTRSAAREETGLAMKFLQTNAHAGEIITFYERKLKGSGWQPFIADRVGQGVGESIRIYTKEGHTCCISVNSSGKARANMITILVKERN